LLLFWAGHWAGGPLWARSRPLGSLLTGILLGGAALYGLLLVAVADLVGSAEPPHEPLNLTSRVYNALFAGVEWVAVGAEVNTQILLSAARLKYVATRASYGGRLVLRMDIWLHW